MWSWGVKKTGEHTDIVETTLWLSFLTLKVHYSDFPWAASVSLRWPVWGWPKTKLIQQGHEASCPWKFTYEQGCFKMLQLSGSGQILIKLIFLFTAHSVTSSPRATIICSWTWLLVLDPICRPYKVIFPTCLQMQLRPPWKSCFSSPSEGFAMKTHTK